ncbi:hypothetical protein ACFWBF_25650 [Streptomyces sp. NPDC060028]|uniref:hypothetical protein n=1 Tax=Streptomyces sp. NPDC060028 TaxID=3347041 RepID=UPI0036AC0194
MAPNPAWKPVATITAGDFTGTGEFDLMVRWSDGELTLYTNVSAGTLGQEYKLRDPNSTWKDATLLTSGQFSGNQKWDLMVRWTSGALNNYVGTTTGGLGAEQPIHGPNKTWSDGETTMYQDTRMNNLGTERMLAPPA